MGEGWCDVDPSELVFTFRGLYICANFCENRSKMQLRECGQTDTLTH